MVPIGKKADCLWVLISSLARLQYRKNHLIKSRTIIIIMSGSGKSYVNGGMQNDAELKHGSATLNGTPSKRKKLIDIARQMQTFNGMSVFFIAVQGGIELIILEKSRGLDGFYDTLRKQWLDTLHPNNFAHRNGYIMDVFRRQSLENNVRIDNGMNSRWKRRMIVRLIEEPSTHESRYEAATRLASVSVFGVTSKEQYFGHV